MHITAKNPLESGDGETLFCMIERSLVDFVTMDEVVISLMRIEQARGTGSELDAGGLEAVVSKLSAKLGSTLTRSAFKANFRTILDELCLRVSDRFPKQTTQWPVAASTTAIPSSHKVTKVTPVDSPSPRAKVEVIEDQDE